MTESGAASANSPAMADGTAEAGRRARRRSPRRAGRPAHTRTAILDAAEHAFLATGFAATAVSRIAARAGVAKGTVYTHFESKEALFVAVVARLVQPAFAPIRLGPVDERRSSLALLSAFLDAMLMRMEEGRLPRILRLLLAEAERFPALARLYHERIIRPGLKSVEAILERGIRRGEWRVPDVAAAARIVIAPVLMHGLWQAVFAPLGAPAPTAPRLRETICAMLAGDARRDSS